MVLSREKRSTAGKAPSRLEQGTPPPSTQPTASTRPVKASQKVSKASQASKKAAAPAKRLILAMKLPGTQPADLRREGDVSTASDSNAEEEEEKELSLQDEDEQADMVINNGTPSQDDLDIIYKTYNVEWSVILGAKSVYHTHIMSSILDYNKQVKDSHSRASSAAEKIKKNAELRIVKASVKIGSQRPLL